MDRQCSLFSTLYRFKNAYIHLEKTLFGGEDVGNCLVIHFFQIKKALPMRCDSGTRPQFRESSDSVGLSPST